MSTTSEIVKRLSQGRTSDQKKVIEYFFGAGGCLKQTLKDEDYQGMVSTVASGTDWRKKALDKVGLDIDQVKEIDPVHFEGYRYDEKTFARWGKDGVWRSSAYQISWLFFSSTQVYVWQYTFSMVDDTKMERTEEYFYKDVTNFSTVSNTIEKEVIDKVQCNGVTTYHRKNVDSTEFALVVPGDKFMCSMSQSDKTERVVQGMKAKLREKKGA